LKWVASQVGTGFAGYEFDSPILDGQASLGLALTDPSGMNIALGSVFTITGAALDMTINASGIPAQGARRITIIIDTASETASRTITFGTGFVSEGTLATGTVANRYFIVEFVSRAGTLYEVSRTGAMS
jgi:hypothetical protein